MCPEAVPVALFGGRGGAEVVAEYFASDSEKTKVIGFLNDIAEPGEKIGSYSVLGAFEDWTRLPEAVEFNAPIHMAKDIQRRARHIAIH